MMRTTLTLFAATAMLGCATTSTVQNAELPTSSAPEAPLPNGTAQAAEPLTPGIERDGSLGCGQSAWYRVTVPGGNVTLRVLGQAQENSLGATATLTVHALTGQPLGEMMIPVFARAPNWDPREQSFMVPTGTYLAEVRLDANSCQRVAYRLSFR